MQCATQGGEGPGQARVIRLVCNIDRNTTVHLRAIPDVSESHAHAEGERLS